MGINFNLKRKNEMAYLINYRSFLLLIGLALNTCLSQAQVTFGQNMYQANDLVERQQVNPASIRVCPDALADLQGMETICSNDVENMEWGTDSLIAIDNAGMNKYWMKGDSLLLVGTESRLMHIDYAQPEVWLRFPMGLGDSIQGLFEGKGQYCERLFLRKIGRYTTKADAWGALIMENSDTLHNVLRIQTERITTTLAQPLDNILATYGTLDSIPLLGNDSIIRLMGSDGRTVRTMTQRYYAPGCRYPVLETCETSIVGGGNSAAQTAAFYSSPYSQESLASANRGASSKSNDRQNNASSADNTNKSFSYSLDIDTSGKTLTVNCTVTGTTEGPVPVNLLLCNQQGILYRQASGNLHQGNSERLSLSYAGLHYGSYVLYIEAGGQQYSEKFNVN
jgi:hypothetical protein